MRAEIHEMKKEQATVSMMDQFARHARLERRINKMTDRLKTHGFSSFVLIFAGLQPFDSWLMALVVFLLTCSEIKNGTASQNEMGRQHCLLHPAGR